MSDVRITHASADAPLVNILIDNDVKATNVDYEDSTGFLSVTEGTHTIAVDGILPTTTSTVIGPVDLDFSADSKYDIIAVNSVSDIEPLVIIDSGELSDTSAVRVRVAHLAVSAPQVDVFVTGSD
jgi:hypothetical protein